MKQLIILLGSLMLLSSCSTNTRYAYRSPERSPKKSSVHRPAPRPAKATAKAEKPAVRSDAAYAYEKADNYVSNRKLGIFINDWLGTPHRIGGRSKDGVDCSGFTTLVMANIYQKNIKGSSADMAAMVSRIDPDELREGDLVFFKIGGTRVSHVGVYLSKGYFAHATLRRGVMLSSLEEPYYKRYFSSAGRLMNDLSAAP